MSDEPQTGCQAPRLTKYEGLGQPDYMNLQAACMLVEHAFNETCYLVGSATERRDFRDVDVRVIMADEKFNALFGDSGGSMKPFYLLTCAAVSAWLRERTGLPVDFQIQRQSHANEGYGNHRRDPLMVWLYGSEEAMPGWAQKRGT